MSIEEISKRKEMSEERIRQILKDLASDTGCVISTVDVICEEGYALVPAVFVEVKINLQIP